MTNDRILYELMTIHELAEEITNRSLRIQEAISESTIKESKGETASKRSSNKS